MRKFQLLLLTAPVLIVVILFLITMPVFAAASSCEEDYIYSEIQEYEYFPEHETSPSGENQIWFSNIGIFIKVHSWGDSRDGETPFKVPTDIQDGELLHYDTFEEYIYNYTQGSLSDVQRSYDLLRSAIIKCSWSAKRLNDIQDGLEEATILGETESLDEIDRILYTLEYGKVKIESYPYVCKN